MGEKDSIILKTLSEPSIEEFDPLVSQVRQQAKIVGLKRVDITDAIKIARKTK
jgi:hypothetical protein